MATTALADILSAVAHELERARKLALQVEDAACVLASRVGTDAETATELQQLDRVIQHLDVLRSFITELADAPGSIDDELIRRGAARVYLDEVRTRLLGGFDHTPQPEEAWEEF